MNTIQSIYKTDVKCTQKNEFAYFIKLNGQFFCVATTHVAAFWSLGELANIDELDTQQLNIEKFAQKGIHGKCKVALPIEFIKSI